MEKKLREAGREYELHKVDMDSFKMRLFQKIEPGKREGLSPKRDGWTLKKIMLVTASVVTIGFSASFVVSPSFANYISSFIKAPPDLGTQNAATQGYSNLAEASATDQGITVIMSEVLADPARLIVSTTLKSESVDVSSEYGLLLPSTKMYLTDEKGNVIANRYDSYRRKGEYGYYQFVLNDFTPKKLQLHLEAKEIRLKGDKRKDGTWNVSVPIDMEKSIAATKIVPLSQTHTTENGLIIQAKSIAYTPSAIRLTLESSWTQEAQNRINQFAEEIQATEEERDLLHLAELDFNILDQSGKVLASNLYEEQIVSEVSFPPLYQSQKKVIEDGKTKNIYEIVFIPDKTTEGAITFEMLGSRLFEPARFQIEIDPLKIKKNSMTKKLGDATVTVTDLSVQKNPETGENGVAIDMTVATGTLKEWDWVLVDEANKTYNLSENRDYGKCSFSGQVETCNTRHFVEGMTQLPKKAILGIRLDKNKYKEEKWDIQLPANPAQK
ncbi:DUF4179 domain-containing protein [Brevibacillus borstelensis]|uniref:DUF4179 domain-containing protein n=1 Tax=Brevibacillus borstelensis TaxID=45462 RepID=UPI0030C0DEA9